MSMEDIPDPTSAINPIGSIIGFLALALLTASFFGFVRFVEWLTYEPPPPTYPVMDLER